MDGDFIVISIPFSRVTTLPGKIGKLVPAFEPSEPCTLNCAATERNKTKVHFHPDTGEPDTSMVAVPHTPAPSGRPSRVVAVPEPPVQAYVAGNGNAPHCVR